jgi:hypothetical protein
MTKDDQAMPALAAGNVEFELNAPALGQATQLAEQFVARHARWMASDRSGVKIGPAAGEDRHCD